MPSDYATNNTYRLRIRYSVGGFVHKLMIRGGRTGFDEGGINAFKTKLGLFLDDLAPRRWADWTLLSAEFASVDSDVFLPTSFPAVAAGVESTVTRTTAHLPVSLYFGGRAVDGILGGFYLYGCSFLAGSGEGADWKLAPGEVESVSDGISRLNDTAPLFTTISGADMIFRDYVTVKQNDYIMKQLRGV